jgi:hypothetical protein
MGCVVVLMIVASLYSHTSAFHSINAEFSPWQMKGFAHVYLVAQFLYVPRFVLKEA